MANGGSASSAIACRRAFAPRAASSSTSTSRGPTRACSATRWRACATGDGRAARPRGAGRRPTSWCRCPTAECSGAIGYSRESGLPYDIGLIRNHYVGRTFIEPQQSIRHFGVRVKLNPVRERDQGHARWCWSTTRSSAAPPRARSCSMVRDAGAAEVHLRISSPPTRWPCYYGIDTPTREELIASQSRPRGDPALRRGRPLAYLSLDGMLRCLSGDRSTLLHRLLDRRVPVSASRTASCQAELFPIRMDSAE